MITRKSIFVLIILFFSKGFICAKDYVRIISLAPSVTKSLYELGVESYVKGITIFCTKGTVKKEIIGSLLDPDIEKIVYMNPDLIIASKDGNSRSVIDKLRRLGFEVYVMEKPESFEDICTIYYGLAEKINKAEKATNIINKAKNYVNRVRAKSNNYSSLKVFWEIGSNPLYTAGGKSFANDYNFYSNTINMYSGVNKNYFQIDMEDVISRNPDIILVINLGKAAKTESNFWYKYKILNASQNNRVFAINSEDMFAPTPLTFAQNLMSLAKIVHGDIFDVK